MWLSNKDRLYNSVNPGEEDIIHAGLVYSTGTVDDNYLQLYASYVQGNIVNVCYILRKIQHILFMLPFYY